MTRITITLEFESDDVDTPEVYKYLKDLMEDGSLEYNEEIIGGE